MDSVAGTKVSISLMIKYYYSALSVGY